MPALTPFEESLLEFERWSWRNRGARDEAVLQLFGLSWPRHVQLVQTLIDRPEAEEYDPVTVRRLRRLRDARARDRASKGHGFRVDPE